MSLQAAVVTQSISERRNLFSKQLLHRLADRFLFQGVSNAPLVIFRMLFGAMMCVSVIRFAANHWIEVFYMQPGFYFPYYGLEWIQPLPGWGIYLVFAFIFLSSLGICLGFSYRLSTIIFFLSFTYVELIDKTYYLNHYYFVSIIAFWLIWLPAHRRCSFDVEHKPALFTPVTSILHINVLRWQTGLVYCYAGLAKINYDWLVSAMPLRLWLPANGHIFGIGFLLKQSWVAYVFSWFGMLYDIAIPFFLSAKKARWGAYAAVILFHGLSAVLFPIGIFPWVMIFSALIFFPPQQQERWLQWFENLLQLKPRQENQFARQPYQRRMIFFGLLLTVQLLLPWRYLLYPGSLFWDEEGYRFSWRVMLMEKAGTITFHITDPATGHSMMVDNRTYLTPQQEKMMATQPDMILQFAHFLDEIFIEKGIENPVVTADAYVTLNGRRSRRFVDPHIDLSEQPLNLKHREWVLPYEE